MIELKSEINCPTCGYKKVEIMPTNACWFFYDCKGCGVKLRPNAGDCCVFCSFGAIPWMPRNGIAIANSAFPADIEHLTVAARERDEFINPVPSETDDGLVAGPSHRILPCQVKGDIDFRPFVGIVMQ